MKLNRIGLTITLLPATLMLVLFYSLALNMLLTLGKWPVSIGEVGFPDFLVTHGEIAMDYCLGLMWSVIFALPLAVLICALIPRCRRFFPYLMLYGLSLLVCWGTMQLAPAQFLYWWWD